METQKTPNSQKAILRKKNGAGGIRLFYFRLYNKATFIKIVFTHTHTHTHTRKYKSMEQDRKLRNKTEHLWSSSLWQRRQDYTIEERQSSVDDAGKTGQLCVKKNEIRTFFDTIHKSKLKMEEQFGMQPVLRSLSSKRERDLVPPLKPEQDYFTSFPNTGMKRTSQSDKRVNSPRKHDSS